MTVSKFFIMDRYKILGETLYRFKVGRYARYIYVSKTQDGGRSLVVSDQGGRCRLRLVWY